MQDERSVARPVVIARYFAACLLAGLLPLMAGCASDGQAHGQVQAGEFESVGEQLLAQAEAAQAASERAAAEAQAAADYANELQQLAAARQAEADQAQAVAEQAEAAAAAEADAAAESFANAEAARRQAEQAADDASATEYVEIDARENRAATETTMVPTDE